MISSLKFYFVFGLLFLPIASFFAQSTNEEPTNWQTMLVENISLKGYQNVVLGLKGEELSIYYENRIKRFEPNAIIDIIQIIANEDLPLKVVDIQVITQKLQIPVLTIKFRNEDLFKWKKGLFPLEQFVKTLLIKQGGPSLQNRKIINSGNFRLELVLQPEIGLGLGGFPDPVIHRLFLKPTFNIFLWKGAQLKTETILPISSEFNIVGEHTVRPGILSFSQNIKLPKHLWLQASLGYFSNNRFGGRLSFAKFLLNGSLTLTGRLGYTGYASYPKKLNLEEAVKGWEYSDINYYDFNVGVNYWFKEWNTQVRLEYGQALFSKEQLKFTCLQRFNEVDIGFFALQTQRGRNYGMILNIPIAPKKYWKPKRIAIRPARTLNYTYQATQATVESYTTGTSILAIHRQLNPAFIKNQLLILKRWNLN